MDPPSCTKVQLKSVKTAAKNLVTFPEVTSDLKFYNRRVRFVFQARERELCSCFAIVDNVARCSRGNLCRQVILSLQFVANYYFTLLGDEVVRYYLIY